MDCVAAGGIKPVVDGDAPAALNEVEAAHQVGGFSRAYCGGEPGVITGFVEDDGDVGVDFFKALSKNARCVADQGVFGRASGPLGGLQLCEVTVYVHPFHGGRFAAGIFSHLFSGGGAWGGAGCHQTDA